MPQFRSFYFVGLLAAVSCAAPRAKPVGSPTLDVVGVIQLLEARYPTIPVAGSASLRVQGRQGKQTVSLGYLFAPPDRLRIDVSTLFGIPLASLAVSSGSFAYFEHGSNRYLSGPLSKAPSLVGLPLPFDPGVFATLLAGVPILAGWSLEKAEWVRTPQGFAFTVRRPGQVMGVGLNQDLLVKRIVYEPTGVTLEFRDYRQEASGLWPGQTQIMAPGQGLSGVVDWGTRGLQPRIVGNPFVLLPPPASGSISQQPEQARE